MEWPHYPAYFFGGAFLANAAPHWVSGVMGRAFRTPFAKPPGEGLSSARVNVLWGFLDLVTGYARICCVADRFGPRSALSVGAASGFAAAVVGVLYLVKSGSSRLPATDATGVPTSDPSIADAARPSP